MSTEELIAQSERYIMNTYRRFPIVLVRGEGSRVWDSDGKEYLDFVAGIAVCSLGHAHPKVVAAIKRQAEILCHISNLYHIEPQIQVAKLLVECSFADKVFFCNSGAEANEGAIKLARRYGHEKSGEDRYELITMKGSFHGRTLATLAATGQERFHAGFEPLPTGFRYVPFDDLRSLEEVVTEKTIGVMVEPIQGEGGSGYRPKIICGGYAKSVTRRKSSSSSTRSRSEWAGPDRFSPMKITGLNRTS